MHLHSNHSRSKFSIPPILDIDNFKIKKPFKSSVCPQEKELSFLSTEDRIERLILIGLGLKLRIFSINLKLRELSFLLIEDKTENEVKPYLSCFINNGAFYSRYLPCFKKITMIF